MKKIIVATDFSSTAINAVNYAVDLSQAMNLDLTLIHANDLTIYSDGVSPMDGNVKMSVQKIAEDQLEREIERIKPLMKTGSATYEFFVGDIVAGLQERCLEGDVALTVMGTTGEHSSGLFWGSRSLNAMRSHNGPILLVPETARFQGISKMMLCMDINKPGAEFPYAEVKHWVQKMNAQLDILNVQPLDPYFEGEDEIVRQEFATLNYSFHTMESEQLSDAITFYLQKNAADWIVVIPKKYNFFESLFHKSKSEIISKASTVPILALHAGR